MTNLRADHPVDLSDLTVRRARSLAIVARLDCGNDHPVLRLPSEKFREFSLMQPTAKLLVSCPDRKGLVARISDFVFRNGGNFLHFDQHTDLQAGFFLARAEWELEGFQIPRDRIGQCFQGIALECGMQFELVFSDHVPKIALFVSRLQHCLQDLLLRHQAGEFNAEIGLIVSNHPDAGAIAQTFGIPFRHFPVTLENRIEQERQEIRELKMMGMELIVLARYMQVLSEQFVDAFPNRIINIHHSFLPAFVGAQPYHQAFARGVKLIGATSHYVTLELDNGPIIEQEIVRVSHRDSLEDLIRKGRDLEKVVLARAVRLHLMQKILTYANRTVIFD
jgi:formyltetrahydrofolate deformylase